MMREKAMLAEEGWGGHLLWKQKVALLSNLKEITSRLRVGNVTNNRTNRRAKRAG